MTESQDIEVEALTEAADQAGVEVEVIAGVEEEIITGVEAWVIAGVEVGVGIVVIVGAAVGAEAWVAADGKAGVEARVQVEVGALIQIDTGKQTVDKVFVFYTFDCSAARSLSIYVQHIFLSYVNKLSPNELILNINSSFVKFNWNNFVVC